MTYSVINYQEHTCITLNYSLSFSHQIHRLVTWNCFSMNRKPRQELICDTSFLFNVLIISCLMQRKDRCWVKGCIQATTATPQVHIAANQNTFFGLRRFLVGTAVSLLDIREEQQTVPDCVVPTVKERRRTRRDSARAFCWWHCWWLRSHLTSSNTPSHQVCT